MLSYRAAHDMMRSRDVTAMLERGRTTRLKEVVVVRCGTNHEQILSVCIELSCELSLAKLMNDRLDYFHARKAHTEDVLKMHSVRVLLLDARVV